MNVRVARRYAKALFLVAKQQGQQDLVASELIQVISTLVANAALLSDLMSPLMSRDKKLEAINNAFANLGPLTLRMLRLLVDKRREENLTLVKQEYDRLLEEDAGILRALISTARPLTDPLRNQLIARLEAETGKRILVEVEIKSEMIGGISVQIGDYLLDGSIEGGLRRLRDRFIRELARQT